MNALVTLWLCLSTTPIASSKQLLLFHLPSGTSPWSEYHHDYKEEERNKLIQAVAILADYERPEHLKAFTAGGEPLLAIDRKGRRVVVNEHHLSDIHRADATGLRVDERTAMGTLRSASLRKDPRLVMRFLIESELIQTYVHVEANLQLMDEKTEGSRYRAVLEGNHVYYTNKRNESRLHFAVEIDTKSGAISVVGL